MSCLQTGGHGRQLEIDNITKKNQEISFGETDEIPFRYPDGKCFKLLLLSSKVCQWW